MLRNVAATTNDTRDQLFTYDGLHRLTAMEQGTDSSGSITSKNFEQDFTLDQLGNWENLTETDGTTTTLDQDRTHNGVNELTTLDVWVSPAYDDAGNMTTMPQPQAPSSSYTLKYDAWNRTVEVKDGLTVGRKRGEEKHCHGYGKRRQRSKIEVWKFNRQISEMQCSRIL